MPSPPDPAATPPDPAWRQQLPGIGLVFGAAVGLIVAILLSDAPIALAGGVVAGGALGLVVGSLAGFPRKNGRREPGS